MMGLRNLLQQSVLIEITISFLAILAAFALVAILLFLIGTDPLLAFQQILYGSVGSTYSIAETLGRTTPLLLLGLGTSIAFRSGVWNIGGEGQLYMGALFAVFTGLYVSTPGPTTLLLAFLGSFVCGSAWAIIPGFLKARLEVNEIITTVLLNFVAIYFIGYMVRGPWRDPIGINPYTAIISASAQLSILVPGTRLHAGLLVAILAIPIVYLLFWKTIFGYRMRVVGANPKAARYGGISVARYIVIAMVLSGGLSGLAGMIEVSGVHHRLMEGISPGYGYLAIAVAILGRLHPVGVCFAAIFFASLLNGVAAAHRLAGVPLGMVNVIIGLVMLFVLASEFLIRRRR